MNMDKSKSSWHTGFRISVVWALCIVCIAFSSSGLLSADSINTGHTNTTNLNPLNNFDQKQWDRDNRHVRRLLSVSNNLRENLKAFGELHSDSNVIAGADNYYIEDVLVDYARVRNILTLIENRWKLTKSTSLFSDNGQNNSEANPNQMPHKLLSTTLSLAAATVSLENSRALLESLDSTIYEDRANRPLNFKGEVYVEDLFTDVDFQVNSRKRKKDLVRKLKFLEDNSVELEKTLGKKGDSASLLLGIIDSSGRLDTIKTEKELVTVGKSVSGRMKKLGYKISKAYNTVFEFVVAIFSRPTVKIKVRKPHINGDEVKKVAQELTEICKPCDIMLHKTGYQANDWIIPGYFSHSGIWLGTASEQEELGLYDPKTNHVSYAVAMKNREHLKSHLVFEGLFGGILSTDITTYMLPCDTIVVLRFKKDYKHSKSDIACKAVYHLGQTYDFGFDVNNIDTIVCSELIYQAYPKSIKWPVTKALGRYTFSPDEIGSMGRAGFDEFPFEVVYFHDGERSYKGADAVKAYTDIVVPKLKFGKPKE